MKHLCLLLLQKLINNTLAKSCTCTLMCFVNYDKIPIGIQDVSLQFLIFLGSIMTKHVILFILIL